MNKSNPKESIRREIESLSYVSDCAVFPVSAVLNTPVCISSRSLCVCVLTFILRRLRVLHVRRVLISVIDEEQ